VHAPLAQRRPRRGAAPTVQIHWLQYSGESLYMKVGNETKFSKWARREIFSIQNTRTKMR